MLEDVALDGRSPVSMEFNRLRDIGLKLTSTIRDVERQRDQAGEAARAASAELARLEHARGAGEAVVTKIVAAEKRLTAARAATAEPWAERMLGAQAAARGAVADAQRFAQANHHTLQLELAEDAHDAKTRADDALGALVDAYEQREAVSRRATALGALVGIRGRDMVPASRLGSVAKEANRVLAADGEQAPIVRAQPLAEAAVS